MPNRPFSFYFRNDGGIARILGVEPLDNNYVYHVKPGTGSTLGQDKPIKIDVQTDKEELVRNGEFSFMLKYADQDDEIYNLEIHIKKMDVKSITEVHSGVHQYAN